MRQIELSRCPICTSGNFDKSVVRRAYRHAALPSKVEISFSVCRLCGFIFQDNPVDEAGLAAYYAAKTQYRSDDLHPVETEVHNKQTRFISSSLDLRAASILEIGAASGKLLDHFRSAYGAKTYFDEMSHQQRERLVAKGHLSGTDIQTADILVMCHVLEHIVEPVAFLDGMRYRANNIFVEVPDWSFADDHTDPLNFEHVNHFTAATLSLALERAGWSVIKTEVDRTPGYATTPFRVLRVIARSLDDTGRTRRFASHVDQTETRFLNGFEAFAAQRGANWKVGFYAASWNTDFILTNAKNIDRVNYMIFDRDPEKQKNGWFGEKVRAPDTIVGERLDTIIITSSYVREIRETLDSLGFCGEVLVYDELWRHAGGAGAR
jgi:hypothetical protein